MDPEGTVSHMENGNGGSLQVCPHFLWSNFHGLWELEKLHGDFREHLLLPQRGIYHLGSAQQLELVVPKYSLG